MSAIHTPSISKNFGRMIVELSESGDEVRFALYDAAGEITASGFIQTEPQYSADYFYNEHDGIAHRCSVPGDILEVDGFGEFTKVSGDKQGDDVGRNTMSGEHLVYERHFLTVTAVGILPALKYAGIA